MLWRVIHLGDLDPIMAGFAALGFLNCAGAIVGTPIPIHVPEHRTAQYINRKSYFSMALQVLVDHHEQFTNIFVWWLGRVHDAYIFWNSSLYRKLEMGTFFPRHELEVGDVQMQLCIVSDVAYPLMPWLMKPYTGHLDPSKDQFNAHLNQASIQVECAFSCLKVQFRYLLTHLDVWENNIPEMVTA
nr:protein ALP1-like [Pelodiscus sinensis]|eukprot:XP_025046154.1 protein ALP1-like [Pelodiscus sinensis]